MRVLRLVIVAAMIIAGVTVVIWRQRVARQEQAAQQAGAEATAALRKVNEADVVFPRRFQDALGGVLMLGLRGDTAVTARALGASLTPLVDEHLALLDRAAALSNTYLALKPIPEARESVDRIARRADALRRLRRVLAEEQAALARGHRSVDETTSRLQQAGASMLLDSLSSSK